MKDVTFVDKSSEEKSEQDTFVLKGDSVQNENELMEVQEQEQNEVQEEIVEKKADESIDKEFD